MLETYSHNRKSCFFVILMLVSNIGSKSFDFHEHQIHVHGKPLLKVTPVDPCVEEGATLRLTCTIVDIPDASQPTTTHSHLPYFFNSSDLMFSSKNKIYQGPPYVTIINSTSINLTIRNFTFEHGGLYLCKINENFVKNGVDSKQYVHVARKPLRPHSIQCYVEELSFLMCTWRPSLEEQADHTKSKGTFSQTVIISVEKSSHVEKNRRGQNNIISETKESNCKIELSLFYNKEDSKKIEKRHRAIYQSIIKSKGNFFKNSRFMNKKIMSKSGRNKERMFAMKNFRRKVKRELKLKPLEDESLKNATDIDSIFKNNKVFNYEDRRTIKYINKKLCIVISTTNTFKDVFSSEPYCFNTDDLILSEEIEAYELDIQKPLSLSETFLSSSESLSPFDFLSFSSSSSSSLTTSFSPSIFSLFSPSYIGPVLYWQVPVSDTYSEVSFEYIINIQHDQLKKPYNLSTLDTSFFQYPFIPNLNYSVYIRAVPVTNNLTRSIITDKNTNNMKYSTEKNHINYLLSGSTVENKVSDGDLAKNFRFKAPSTIPCKSPFFDAFSIFYDSINSIFLLYWIPIEEKYNCGRDLKYEIVMFTNTYQKSLINAIKKGEIIEKSKKNFEENNDFPKNYYDFDAVYDTDCYYNHYYYNFRYNNANQFNNNNNVHFDRDKQTNFSQKNNLSNENSSSENFIKNIISIGTVPGSKGKTQFSLSVFKLCKQPICVLSVLAKNDIGYSPFKVSTIYLKNPFMAETYETNDLSNETTMLKLNIKNNTVEDNFENGNYKTSQSNFFNNIDASFSSNITKMEGSNEENDDDDLDSYIKSIDFAVVKVAELGPIVIEKNQDRVLVTTSLIKRINEKADGDEDDEEGMESMHLILYWCSYVVYGVCESVLNWEKLEVLRNIQPYGLENTDEIRGQNTSEPSKNMRFKKSLKETSLKVFEKIVSIQDNWSIGVGLFDQGVCEHPVWLKHVYKLGGELKPPSSLTIKEIKITPNNQVHNSINNDPNGDINKRNNLNEPNIANSDNSNESKLLKVCWIHHQSTCSNCSYTHFLLLEYCTKTHGAQSDCQETTRVSSRVGVDEKCHTLAGNFDEKKEYIFWMRSVDIKGRKSFESEKILYRTSKTPSHMMLYIVLIILIAIVLLIVACTAFKLYRRVKVYKEKIMGIEIPQNRYIIGYKSSLNLTYEYTSTKVSEAEPHDSKCEIDTEYVDKNILLNEAERENLLQTSSKYGTVTDDKLKRRKKGNSGEKNTAEDNDMTNNVVDNDAAINSDNSFMLGAYVKVQANSIHNNKAKSFDDSYIINNKNIVNPDRKFCHQTSVYITNEQKNGIFPTSRENHDVNDYLKFSEVIADTSCNSDDDASTYCDSSLLRDESFFNDNFIKSHKLVCQTDLNNTNYYKALNKSDESYDYQKNETSKSKTIDFNKTVMKSHDKTKDPNEHLFNATNIITSPYIEAKTQIVFTENLINSCLLSDKTNNQSKESGNNHKNNISDGKLTKKCLKQKEEIYDRTKNWHIDNERNVKKEKIEEKKRTFYSSLTPLIKEDNVVNKIENINGFCKKVSKDKNSENLLLMKNEKKSNTNLLNGQRNLEVSERESNFKKELKQPKIKLPLQNHFLQHPQLINQPTQLFKPQTSSLHSQPATQQQQNYVIPSEITIGGLQPLQQSTRRQQTESENSVLSPYVTLSSKELFPSLNHSDSETNDDLSDSELNMTSPVYHL